MSIKIFVTTDNHVGYNETDAVKGDDAATSFHEAMTIAQHADVDFVIQGGDLFHINKPTKRSMYSVIKTLRTTCLGDKPVEFEVLNHGPLALGDAHEFDYPNFEDPNLNVAIPVFAISGNHDDAGGAVGANMLSPLDVLSMAGLINHFGRVYDSSAIVVKPILIEKAGVRLALYGLASVRDERLYRTFRDNKVKFLRPSIEPETWYSILVVHQNHVAHGPTNFLPPEFLPNFVDLVIWGHEHECLIDPVPNPTKGFLVMQPGSTVATSLSESETKPKHVAVLSIGPNKSFSYEKIPLKTVRPFAMRTVSLANDTAINPGDRDARAKVTEWLVGQVEELIEEAKLSWTEQHSANDDQDRAIENNRDSGSKTPPLPLIRLKVDYTGYEVENTTRFSNRFIGQVANTTDVLRLVKRRDSSLTSRIGPKVSSADVPQDARQANNIKQVSELVHELLKAEKLDVLPARDMGVALSRFVEKDEKSALKESVDVSVQSRVARLLESVNELAITPARTPPRTVEVPLSSVSETGHGQSVPGARLEPGGAESPEPEVVVSDSEDELEPERPSPPVEIKAKTTSRNIKPSKSAITNSRSASKSALNPDPGPKPASKPARQARSARPTFESQPTPPPLAYDGDDDSEDMFSSS